MEKLYRSMTFEYVIDTQLCTFGSRVTLEKLYRSMTFEYVIDNKLCTFGSRVTVEKLYRSMTFEYVIDTLCTFVSRDTNCVHLAVGLQWRNFIEV